MKFVILPGMLLIMPGIALSKSKRDTLLVNKIFTYRNNFIGSVYDTTSTIYLKYSFLVNKRNPTLFFVPSMYTIAKGSHSYIGETYGKIKFNNICDYSIQRQITVGSISNHNKTMPIMLNYIIPDLYNQSLFDEHILSPFYIKNTKFYKYSVMKIGGNNVRVLFRPYMPNTQLVSGSAIVDCLTGRIKSVTMSGSYDMIHFNIKADMGDGIVSNPLLPVLCNTQADFSFLGNKINTSFSVVLGNRVTYLQDSIKPSLNLMDKIRPIPLNDLEKDIYQKYMDENSAIDTTENKSLKRTKKIKKVVWDIIGDHMLNSMGTKIQNGYIKLSPLMNPLYLNYSGSRGLSYRINIGACYNFSNNSNIMMSPKVGYNFKIKKWHFEIPLRYTYNKKNDAWTEFTWKTGNRITNSSVLDILKDEMRDTVDFSSLNLDYFDDRMLMLRSNIAITRKFDLTMGCVFHQRNAVNKEPLILMDKPTSYRSFAPQVTLSFIPYTSGPVFTANYERSLLGVFKSDTEYEKWEFDLSFKKKMNLLRRYSLRIGGGFYTNKSTEYFVDFSNFCENYIPGGWDDDWSGNFQLLNSQWYNASKYYIRTNVSYESPLLLFTWMPFVGKYIELERLYLSALNIEHTRPYFELGYGLTNRYFSFGLFGSFLNGKPVGLEGKFTLELFKKW